MLREVIFHALMFIRPIVRNSLRICEVILFLGGIVFVLHGGDAGMSPYWLFVGAFILFVVRRSFDRIVLHFAPKDNIVVLS